MMPFKNCQKHTARTLPPDALGRCLSVCLLHQPLRSMRGELLRERGSFAARSFFHGSESFGSVNDIGLIAISGTDALTVVLLGRLMLAV